MNVHLMLLVLMITAFSKVANVHSGNSSSNISNENILSTTTTVLINKNDSIISSSNIKNDTTISNKSPFIQNNNDRQISEIANSVATSSELQGATTKMDITQNQYRNDRTASSVSTTPSLETTKKDSLTNQSNEKFTNNQQSSTTTTTTSAHRNVRNNNNGSSFQNRDNKLMSLLAARRSALQLGRFRTHRRVPLINSTLIETTSSSAASSSSSSSTTSSSKNPQDSRTTCERNCTKNFTRRTTASCMRRCIMMHNKVPATTTSTTTTLKPSQSLSVSSSLSSLSKSINQLASKASPRTKVDEKDNNEILLTDESSHGFFVVTKELNDTINHISSDAKMIITSSTEKNHQHKIKSKLLPRNNQQQQQQQHFSTEEIDMTPYVYFGRKLPPLKPTALRISKVDDNPKVLEISVTKPTVDRSRGRVRYHPRDRNIVAYNRRLGLANVTSKQSISSLATSSTTEKSSTSPSVDLLKGISEDKLIKEAIIDDDSLITVLTRSAENQSSLAKIVLENNSSGTENKSTNSAELLRHSHQTPVTLVLEDQSTPLVINIPENEETLQRTTIQPPEIKATNLNIPYNHNFAEEKPNLIIFFNITTPKPISTRSTTRTPSSSTTTTPSTTTTTITTTTTTTSTTTSTTTAKPTTPTIKATSTPKPSTTTSTTTTTTEIPSTAATPKIETFTKTTISSSIRSTVNSVNIKVPSLTSTTKTPQIMPVNQTTPLPENFTFSFDIFPNISPNFQEKNPSASNNPTDADSNIIQNGEVTIEMQRINLATYVLAGLGMFPLLIIILYVAKTLIFKRQLKDDTDLDHCMNDEQPISPVRKMDYDDERNIDHYSMTSDQEFNRNNLRFKSLLGEGNFGQVWKAEADDLSGHMGTTRIVAVKTIRSGSSQSGLKEEAQIMRKLGSHPNVVVLLGACIETEPHLLIMEYAMRGRLLSLLRAARSATNILPASVPGGRSLAPLSPRTLAGFALDIARGMEYIADKKIVHRDLAARNVLLDHNGVCKICDFGMSIDLEAIKSRQSQSQPTRKLDNIIRHANGLENRFRFDFGGRLINNWNHFNNNNNNNNEAHEKKHHHDSINRRPALPIRWMAPEALKYHIYSTETDVWAFGIVLWEIATLGSTPYPNLTGREVIRCVPNGTRPDPPKDGRNEFWDLMCKCWHKNPHDRPTFREARLEISRSMCNWIEDDTSNSDYMDVSGFSEDLEHGMVYFNRRISEFECEI